MVKRLVCCIALMAGIGFINGCGPSKKTVVMPPNTADTSAKTNMPDMAKTDAFLASLLAASPQYFKAILQHKKDWNVQVIYTQVNRGSNGVPNLQNYYFNVDPSAYFYPASTVKFPVSILALQRLNELKSKGIDKNTTIITEAGTAAQTVVYNDPTAPDGRPTIAQYIKKIMMVSDNDAFNRLYEFLGQEYINRELHKKGYKEAQLLHRLQITLPAAENWATNPIQFLDGAGVLLHQQPLAVNKAAYQKRSDTLGKAYYKSGVLIQESMDFSTKNRISLESLHQILISLVFPDIVPAQQRFNITAEDRAFLLQYMSQLPTESTYPPYSADTAAYWPAYCKFLLYGSRKGELPKNIRIFNKVGDAYGQMLDVAYIADYEKKVEFFLSAVIYCNSDGVLNDDKYDYNTIGFPFMKNLGQVIYDYELQREKKYLPDLSDLMFRYDKD